MLKAHTKGLLELCREIKKKKGFSIGQGSQHLGCGVHIWLVRSCAAPQAPSNLPSVRAAGKTARIPLCTAYARDLGCMLLMGT